ncbi:MAG: sulfotransferase domain-containing protein [Nitrospirales bacterium]
MPSTLFKNLLFHPYLRPLSRFLKEKFCECPLPEFLIIGGQKCGTTSLYAYLMQHPGILPPEQKEIHYFERPNNFYRGPAWYRRHFPSSFVRTSRERQLGYAPITGEATPCIDHPHVPQLVHELLPDVKLIALFRNPVDRAFSQYHHNRKIPERESLTFEEAIAQSPRTLLAEVHMDAERAPCPKRRNYITRGLYAEQLHYWFQCFPKERFHFLSSEEFFEKPALTVQEVLKFLNMPDCPIDYSVPRHVGGYEAEMSREMKEYLEEIYRPHNRKLYELTGRNFGW